MEESGVDEGRAGPKSCAFTDGALPGRRAMRNARRRRELPRLALVQVFGAPLRWVTNPIIPCLAAGAVAAALTADHAARRRVRERHMPVTS